MKVHLMSPCDDFALDSSEPPFADDLVNDLELDYLFEAMADGDSFLRAVSRAAVLQSLVGPEAIRYRQEALADCVAQRDVVVEIYGIAVAALERPRSVFFLPVHGSPARELQYAVARLNELATHLERLRDYCAGVEERFHSPAFRQFFARVARELDESYMAELRETLRELSFPDGMVMSAGIGVGGTVTAQILRRPKDANRGFFDRTPLKRPLHSFTLPDRDESGEHALSELRDRSVNDVANAASQSLDHVMRFFEQLRAEIGFYRTCGNLAARLSELGAPICLSPAITADATRAVALYDPCLALHTSMAPMGNDVVVPTGTLLVITGANRGGKSTLLRALGVAQLMMQAGMFVPAQEFAAKPAGHLLTHWAREEDSGLAHGKLDEELDRMERIVAVIRPGDLLLSNESFASTNEAEGSQIAREVTSALIHVGVQVRVVTHLYDFAQAIANDKSLGAVFLRAPRERDYRLEPGPPLPTSFGLDLYDQVFGTNLAATDAQSQTSSGRPGA